MEVNIVSEKSNPLLERREIHFHVKHDQRGSTPPRLEIKKAVAASIKIDPSLVFVKKFETKTGTHTAVGIANVYDSIEKAKLIEPKYIVRRNISPEKPKEKANEGNK